MPSPYPPDEFDEIADSDRRGTHREKSARLGGVSSIVFVAIVVVVVALLGIAAVNIVNSGNTGTDGQTANSGNNGKSDSHRAAKTSKPGKSSPPTKSKSPAAPVDKSQSLQVLNSTTTAGMAERASDKLRSDGWTIGTTANYHTPQNTTTVYYSSSRLKSTATAVAKALGTTSIKQSTQFSAKVTVVLGSDYSDSQ